MGWARLGRPGKAGREAAEWPEWKLNLNQPLQINCWAQEQTEKSFSVNLPHSFLTKYIYLKMLLCATTKTHICRIHGVYKFEGICIV